MKDIEVNGAHITDESAEILKQWQIKDRTGFRLLHTGDRGDDRRFDR